ncbi:MAG: hypothetical protein A2W85_03680 [Bacteroidetes bacterium GWF2_41_31]|nr:MAG: hypothetical protein A2W85_03680 [Bacteroidetes bacterium GWF2_41_31]
MKKLFFLLVITTVLICSSTFGQSQTQNKFYYAEAVMASTSDGIGCNIDFGKDYVIPVEKKDEIIKKIREFKNGVDIVNYLSDLGWEYVDKQVVFEVVPRINYQAVQSRYWIYTFRKLK